MKLLEQALIVEQTLYEVAEAALSSTTHQNQLDPVRTRNLAICLSNKLIQTGARKRIALPKDPRAREATRTGLSITAQRYKQRKVVFCLFIIH